VPLRDLAIAEGHSIHESATLKQRAG